MTLLLSISTSLIGCSRSTTAHSNQLSTPITSVISTAPNTVAANGSFKSGDNGEFKTVMDRLVKDGTITIAQEIAIQTAITIANQDAAENGDFDCIDNAGSQYVMDGLVKDGTITIVQEITIQNAITTAKEEGNLHLNVAEVISYASYNIAGDLNATAILTPTQSGLTAQMISKYRPKPRD